ncbi:hypothetical protein Acr_04g0010580 [Actinidia rufa]|uniref:Uncharacterized protein n=1 Tax=Actinidia rufa TaxID=165716 RepID=A0A7J0EIV7_9ERIC|nr:hypothetical protein Acr_04g0010580 [Actinidia rufa]
MLDVEDVLSELNEDINEQEYFTKKGRRKFHFIKAKPTYWRLLLHLPLWVCWPHCSKLSRTTQCRLSKTTPFPIHHHQDSDLKTLTNQVFPQPSFSPTANKGIMNTNYHHHPSPSMLFKSLVSHQVCTLKEQTTTVPKQRKTEAKFSPFHQLPDANLRWLDRIHYDPQANPTLFLGMDCGMMGFSSATTDTATTVATPLSEMSTSIAFNKACIQTLVHPPIRSSVTGESWPLDL